MSAQSIGIAYGLVMVVDGLVNFDAAIDYTSSTEGALDTLVHFSRSTPGGYFTVVSDSGSLPALPGLSTLKLSGYFQLQVDDTPGGASTEIDVHGVPEPGGLVLAGLGILSGLRSWCGRFCAGWSCQNIRSARVGQLRAESGGCGDLPHVNSRGDERARNPGIESRQRQFCAATGQSWRRIG